MAKSFWPEVAARVAQEEAQLLPTEMTRAQYLPVAQSVVSAISSESATRTSCG